MENFLSVIVTYNPDMELFQKCICSILVQVSKVLVIDNGSSNYPDIADFLEKNGWENVGLEHFSSNRGLAYAYNHAFEMAKDMGMQAVLTLDQDTICPPTLVESLSMCLEEDNVAIACPACHDRNDSRKIIENGGIKEIPICINSGALIKVKAWEIIGGYDEVLFIDDIDTDFCLRVTAEGYKIKQVTSEIISHAIGAITEHRLFGKTVRVTNHCPERRYYQIRNGIYLYYKNGRKSKAGNPVKRIIKAMVKIWLWENDKWKKTVAIFRGARDGCRLGKRIYG